ncbi:RNA-binding cell elongation regulator Jag/EloR [Miniphocaeibacter halophilus]|uniref:Jag N-terminal domain-containing protein n=1 Tax=Miniphocaeibacter halophilus TaxID=2931922 RepID=A0AC61MTG5_9FIRM|nr:RNA-binding cell elongation regulator Jag/EloR [Miniphocaeibacter halophilus]QQK08917.1 Jag N-terminal domain-containing protein [Miniphocaeibacter halophilus]
MKSTVKVAKTVEEAVNLAIKELNCTKEEAIVEILEEPKSGFFGLIGSKDAVVKVSCEENIEELLNEVTSPNFSTKEKKEEKKEEVIVEEINTVIEEEIIVEEISEKERKKDIRKERKKEDSIQKDLEIDSLTKEEIKVKTKEFLNDIVSKMGIKANIETFNDENFTRFNIVPENDGDIGIVIGKRGETLDAIQYLVNLVANRNSKEYMRISVDSNNYREKRIRSLESLAVKMANKAKKYNRNMKLEPMNPYERRIIHSALQNVSGVYTVSEGDEPYRRVIIKIKRKKK